ncbi:MAG: hypothetical protein A2359_02260 [Candidatus Moranbacteria bacterium RIFOXYB1_FULL_43_19]|nr:MAG: hypothetical protein A2184_04510 [Candidatus Moranbacteria bacterium RIFOXYA1_FULL_44_7]OGI28003.1 MAG: hypothetical protein A2359_02260 [Candidatus Moranbacteria bacterium RIFOXYB1_FULL_43_19]OGI33549.1 MAG: hypothetical protein A2420_00305 [Candidatus Moranbacteria bacterium RIFOXYC1_FULL_44_13]OGI37524.1 MAG: hypothetical protein A2612_05310 [Candidatus Moranbacteria bacterium RIFOXYD1_FULL_44_12]
MAKSKEQFLARNLRKKGLSIKEIAEKLNVSKSSASLWCSDIQLTEEQTQKLHTKMIRGSYKGRMVGAKLQKEKKRKRIEECLRKARKDIYALRKRELFIAGLALYWGEGSKSSSGVRFHNSDPAAIQFAMNWFRKSLKVERERFLMYVNINEIHKARLREVVKYWSKITKVSASQFRKPILIKAKNKKFYENFSHHYGTLSIRIAKSSDLLYQILGWIEALNEAA